MLKSLLTRFSKKYKEEFINKYLKVAKTIEKLRYPDENHIFDPYVIQEVIDKFVLMNAHHIKNWVDEILTLQKEPHKTYCDIDWGVDIIENTDKRSIITIKDYVVCTPDCNFIIIDNKGKDLHIRLFYDGHNSDCRKGNKYIKKPNLKYFRDNHYDVGLGDFRDPGYVFSMDYSKYGFPKLGGGFFWYYIKLEHITRLLQDTILLSKES